MPSLDERREVAARLREEAELHKEGFDPLALIDCLGIDIDGELFNDGWHRYPERITFETWQRLADLIEPLPERTCRVERMEIDEFGRYFYLSCGHMQMTHNTSALPYCPNCGAKVVE